MIGVADYNYYTGARRKEVHSYMTCHKIWFSLDAGTELICAIRHTVVERCASIFDQHLIIVFCAKFMFWCSASHSAGFKKILFLVSESISLDPVASADFSETVTLR